MQVSDRVKLARDVALEDADGRRRNFEKNTLARVVAVQGEYIFIEVDGHDGEWRASKNDLTKPSRDNIIRQLQTLFASAESAKGLGDEAQADMFMAKAHDLLSKHKLEMSDLSAAQQAAEEPMGTVIVTPFDREKMQRELWTESLAHVVAAAHHCKVIIITTGVWKRDRKAPSGYREEQKSTNKFMIVGRSTDRQICAYVFARVAQFAHDECKRQHSKLRYELYWNNDGDMSGAHGFKDSFYRAFTARVRERYREMAKQTDASSGGKYALIVLSSSEAVDLFVKEKIETTPVTDSARAGYDSNALARSLGREAADRANLRGDGLAPGGDPAKGVGGGPRGLLGAG